MTTEREKIIALATEYQIADSFYYVNQDNLVDFVKKAQADALEAAANACDELAIHGVSRKDYMERAFAEDCAAAIREMAKEKQNAD